MADPSSSTLPLLFRTSQEQREAEKAITKPRSAIRVYDCIMAAIAASKLHRNKILTAQTQPNRHLCFPAPLRPMMTSR